MTLDDRIDHIRQSPFDLLVCALPANVLMLSGYWPIVGTGVACVDRDGKIQLLVPQDEEALAAKGWAKHVATFQPGSLENLTTAAQSIVEPLRQLINGHPKRIGYEHGETSEPASYCAMNLYNCGMPDLLKEAFPHAALEPADDLLFQLRSVKTDEEIARIRCACRTAQQAFQEGSKHILPGIEEQRAARNFREPLWLSTAERADGMIACMSGSNSGHAYGAFARSTHKPIAPGDVVLTHCNSYEDGYWTDITRTYVAGDPDVRQQTIFEAIQAACKAAISAIKPGVAASDVDRAARETLAERGFGPNFKHSTGHGVGFGAIDAHARPRIHPKSPDRLEAGMVFNIEPGVYFPDYGGARHCDMVALTATGPEVLTPFQPCVPDPVLRQLRQ